MHIIPQALLLVLGLALAVRAIDPNELAKFCHVGNADANHFQYKASECTYQCTDYASNENGTLVEGLACSMVLKEWCDGGQCRHFDKKINTTVENLIYSMPVVKLDAKSIRMQACAVSSKFNMSDTPLLDRKHCVACKYETEAHALDGKPTKVTADCKLPITEAVLVETYVMSKAEAREVMFGAEFHNLPAPVPQGKKIERFLVKSIIDIEMDKHGKLTEDIKLANYFLYN